MYCRNCGNEVNEKAIGCPKCGLDPRTEKNFCPGCGTTTNPNQVVCVQCGISLGKQSLRPAVNVNPVPIPQVDVQGFLKSKAFKIILVLAVIGGGIYAYFWWEARLHKDKAQELISKEYGIPKTIRKPIQHGLIDFGYNTSLLKESLELAENGLLTCEKSADYWSNYVYQINITKKAEKYKIKDSFDNSGRQFYIFKIAEMTFGEIIKIEESPDGKSAEVEYMVNYVTNPVCSINDLYQIDLNVETGKEKNTYTALRTEYFKKTDKGWEIGYNNNYDASDFVDELINGVTGKKRRGW